MSSLALAYEAEATRSALWLRGFFFGPTGGGKSKGALRIASTIFDAGLRPTLINSELGRGRLYADRIKYDLIDLGELTAQGKADFSPDTWMRALDLAEQNNPGGIFILDSVSHEWMGKNGILQQADRFGDWKTVRPKHSEFVERLLAVQGHVIVCCRAKMKYEVTEEPRQSGNGTRQVITPLGVGPIQDDGLQYEFNLVAQFEQRTHECLFTGHVDPLVDTVHDLDDDADLVDVTTKLEKWLSDGDPIAPPPAASEEEVAKLRAVLDAGGADAEAIEEFLTKGRRRNRGQLHPEWVAEQVAKAEAKLREKSGGGNAASAVEGDAATGEQQTLAPATK